jgi:hypothetical protein
MTLDTKLRWKTHVMDLKYKRMYWLMGGTLHCPFIKKLLLYKEILKAIRAYAIQLWGCTKQSNINIIQRFQNEVLRNVASAPWYVRNNDLHRDLQVNVVSSEIQSFAQTHGGFTIMRTVRPYCCWTTRA